MLDTRLALNNSGGTKWVIIMIDSRKKSKPFVHIGDILQALLPTYRRETRGILGQVADCWPDVVGSMLSTHTRPAALNGKLLLVHVANASLTHQLHYMQKEIISKLNTTLGNQIIDEIRFKIGPV
ncbi:MAG: DUF721 domain-containing protein [Deltaproteobacteria bacterium]|nr:DUF721 domain-containing protein [Deltaproteobacteria bacterium]